MNSQVTNYINSAPSEQKEIMNNIRKLIHSSVPGVTEEFKWSRPVFKTKREFAYLKASKAYVSLGFFNFEKLNDSQNRLEGTGKDMRHIKLKTSKDVDSELLRKWFIASAD